MAGERSSRESAPAGAAYVCFQGGGGDAEREAWAALLVVTAAGLPEEFLYAGPIRPTPVQSILYQDALTAQVRVSLLRALVRGIRSRPLFFATSFGELAGLPPDEFPAPALVVDEERHRWLSPPSEAAERLAREVEQAVGVCEPLGRARAALAYVVDYERRKTTSSGMDRSDAPPEAGPRWS